MAKCKLCKTNIPDQTEYCEDCRDKGNAIANESYLDSLLNSVKNTGPTAENIYKKKNPNTNSPAIASQKSMEIDPWDSDYYRVDLSDIEDFDKLIRGEELDGDDILIKDEELFGVDLSKIFKEENSNGQEKKEAPEPENSKILQEEHNSDSLEENYSGPEEVLTNTANSDPVPMNAASVDENPNDDQDISDTNINHEDILEFEEEDNFDDDLNELLNNLDIPTVEPKEEEKEQEEETSLGDGIEFAREEELEHFEEEEDDFLSLLNQIASDDPVAGDVKAINDLLQGKPVQPDKATNVPSDVGEVFSDALKVVSSLNDTDIDEQKLLSKIPDKSSKKGKKAKNTKKAKKEKSEVTAEKPKKSLFQRLFANVEEEGNKKKTQKPVGAESDEAKKEKKAKKKAAKGNKGAVEKEEEDIADGPRGKGKPGTDQKADKKATQKDKKANKKKEKEIIQVIDEIDEDEGRINRLGASIVFLFFGLLVLLLLVGTNVVSYTLSIQNATSYFDKQKYTQAYNEVYGIEIKDEDIEIYDKIMTVMFVNKQLNSYNSFYSLKQYPEALDSLLKGLKRYDKYIELATMLGIKTDLDYVRFQILAELNNVFQLSEEEAMLMNTYDSMEEYSLKVYDVVLERMNN